MKILNYFDKAFYINLDAREDRKKSFEARIKKLKLEVERFSAIEVAPKTNSSDQFRHFKEGCIRSHKAIVRYAKENNLDNVLIFEDDCTFIKDFNRLATSVCNQLYNEHWDLFYFGGEPNGATKPYKDKLRIAPNGMYQTHAYAINKSYYDKVLEVNPETAANIDIFYLHAGAKSLLSDKLLCKQEDGFSDNFGMNIKFDYSKYND